MRRDCAFRAASHRLFDRFHEFELESEFAKSTFDEGASRRGALEADDPERRKHLSASYARRPRTFGELARRRAGGDLLRSRTVQIRDPDRPAALEERVPAYLKTLRIGEQAGRYLPEYKRTRAEARLIKLTSRPCVSRAWPVPPVAR